MPVKLKDVHGYMIKENGACRTTRMEVELGTPEANQLIGWDKALAKQGQRSIGLNRYKLMEVIIEARKKPNKIVTDIVDAIIANEQSIIEFKE